jgi:plastocyanin
VNGSRAAFVWSPVRDEGVLVRRITTAAVVGLISGLVALAPATAAHAQTTAAAPESVVVNVSTNCTYFCFAPAQVSVAAGGTVTWVNQSGTVHNIARCTPANCSGKAGGTGRDPKFTAAGLNIAATGTATYTFTQPGTYVYFCTIHGYALMHGTITVTAAPPSTTAPITAAVPAAPLPPAPVVAPTSAPGPTLASTGGSTSGLVTLAILLIVAGLTGTSVASRHHCRRSRRRRRSRP